MGRKALPVKNIYLTLFSIVVLLTLFGQPKYLGPAIKLEPPRSGIYQPVQSPWVR